ncbi:MAG: septum formation initiator family protein [Clostridia bacterium]|nr:septum formation initiator family protein [Clostridia bacterium]
MDEQKLKKVVAASVVIAVVLLSVLLTFMVYQMIAIGAKKRQIDDLNGQIEALEQQKKDTQDKIDYWLSDWKIEERARELEWYYPSDR